MDELAKYRLETAKERLISSKLLLEAGQYRDSIGRSYYAIFSAVRAVLATDRVDFSKHSGVISFFQREYVKTNIFDVRYSKILQNVFQIRNVCDYDDFFLATKDSAEEQYNNAKEMIEVIDTYLSECNSQTIDTEDNQQ